ncbi:MAG TPA: hypothetical protein VKE95_02585 [Burkholderiales bacterium]|nr:hypothetical protein [Burkholderiales bacterium]
MKSVNFASVLFIAAALGLWACQHPVPAEKVASALTGTMAR